MTNRLSNDLIVAAHQKLSREWWEKRQADFEFFVSTTVFDEISRGNAEQAEKRMAFVKGLPVLSTSDEA